MAREVKEFQVTVPAGTTQAAPLVSATALGNRELRRVEWRFPPGCAGLVGFYISMGKVQVLPLPAGTWVVDDGFSHGYDVTGQPNTGAYQVTAYNLGAFSHTITVRYLVDLLSRDDPVTDLLPDQLISNMSTQLGDPYH